MRASILLPLGIVACVACSSSSSETPSISDTGARADVSLIDTIAVDTTPALDTTPAPDTRAETPGDAATCALHQPYSTKNATCNACAQEHCCAPLNGCFDDTRCNDDYVNCILACALLPDDAGPDAGDATGACLADCGTMHPAGKAGYDAAIACVDGACATPCK